MKLKKISNYLKSNSTARLRGDYINSQFKLCAFTNRNLEI